jgi:hypothetical protein
MSETKKTIGEFEIYFHPDAFNNSEDKVWIQNEYGSGEGMMVDADKFNPVLTDIEKLPEAEKETNLREWFNENF